MTLEALHQKLQEAYNLENLNRISLTLLNLYKEKQFARLREITSFIDDLVEIKIDANGKGFSRLIMLYHPDRASFHLNEINRLAAAGDLEGLQRNAHILRLKEIEVIASSFNNYEEIDFSPVYEWDVNATGYTIVDEKETKPKTSKKIPHYNFYDAIKIREYGHTDLEFPSYYLEDFESFELSSSNIDDLDGVQFCRHVRNLDLSNNLISDLSWLENLEYLEDLNLADNQVGFLDSLSYISTLKRLYLANNAIEDLSPIFDLPQLEYIDISGNPVPMDQMKQLKDLGVSVDY